MMRRRLSGMVVLVAALTVGGLHAPLHAADTPAEIDLQRKLDSRIDLVLTDKPLSDAFAEIAKVAKINIFVDEACYDALPYGPTTRVNATFRSSPVRASIEVTLQQLGLEQAVSGATLVIRPTPALVHIGRRAEWDEIHLLEWLRITELPAGKLDGGWTAALKTQGKSDVAVEARDLEAALDEKALAQVKSALPMSFGQALDQYCALTGQIWTVRKETIGQSILIMSPRKWVERQLDRPVIIQKKNAPLNEVVAELSHISRLRFQPEPGLYARVPPVSLNFDNATLRRSLDSLSGATGLAYDVRDDGVYLHMGDKPGAKAADPIVGRIAVPVGNDNLMFDMFIYESDLPADLNEIRKKRLAEAVAELRIKLRTPPATAPSATTPASQPAATGSAPK